MARARRTALTLAFSTGSADSRRETRPYGSHRMFERLRAQWHLFRADPPGRRFELRHARHRAHHRSVWHRAFVISLGVVAIIMGIAMLVLPGPGLLVVLLGAFLLGEDSLSASRLLDRCDAWCSRRLPRRRGVE